MNSLATRRVGTNMRRQYNKWSQLLTGEISVKDHNRICNSVHLYVQTPKGWNGIGVFFTQIEAQEFIDRILAGKIRLNYAHEKIFKIGKIEVDG
jgi:hypothetical protein